MWDMNFAKIAARQLTSGTTTAVVTWWISPWQEHSTYIHEILKDFKYFELPTVIRGTKNIINEWKGLFPDGLINVGHVFPGEPVERHSVNDFSGILEIVCPKILLLLDPWRKGKVTSDSQRKDNQCGLQQWKPSDIALLTIGKRRSQEANKIRESFAEQGIRCGTITEQVRKTEQVKKPALIAVQEADHAHSYDWPIVIVVVFSEEKRYKKDPLYLVAASRAFVKLIIIEVKDRTENYGTGNNTIESASIVTPYHLNYLDLIKNEIDDISKSAITSTFGIQRISNEVKPSSMLGKAVVKELLSHINDREKLWCRDILQRTPMHYVSQGPRNECSAKIVELLMEKNEELLMEASDNEEAEEDIHGCSALLLAVDDGSLPVVEALLSNNKFKVNRKLEILLTE
uniref:Uncharacterized protein n=1 Tax=Plectus sambesii TaxID=2011161 RepID=A0A914VY68_9BILA